MDSTLTCSITVEGKKIKIILFCILFLVFCGQETYAGNLEIVS